MATIEDGNAAFPINPPLGEDGFSAGGYPFPEAGMTLRDWFAGQALIGMLSSGLFLDPDGLWCGNGAPPTAEGAYLFADAMIAARKGGA